MEQRRDEQTERPRFNGIIRKLEEKDIPAVREILETWVVNLWTKEVLQDEVEEHMQAMRRSFSDMGTSIFLVAEENDRVVGVIGMDEPGRVMREFSKTDNPVEFIHIYVSKDDRRGRGVGTALVNGLENEARKRGHTEILFNSGPRYKRTGWPFHDQLPGFSRIGIAKNYYGKGLDAPVWQKIF